MPGMFYVAVAQAVFIYESETWVMYPHIWRTLGDFHHRVACRMMGLQPSRGKDETWVNPPLEEEMAESGMQEVDTCVSRP